MKCEICNKEITHVTSDNKLIGLCGTADGYICNKCIDDSENAGHVEFANDHDPSIKSFIIKEGK